MFIGTISTLSEENLINMKKINKKLFFDNYPYSNLSKVKTNLNFLIDKFDASTKLDRIDYFAYILGTLRRETNDTFAPVEEGYWIPASKRAAALKKYYVQNNPGAVKTIFPASGLTYYGRGYVQLTHDWNYKKFQPLIQQRFPAIDIFAEPIKACDPEVAWIVLEEGMTRDDLTIQDENFTGFTLEQFFNDQKQDWVKARKIINGMDHANEIAQYAIAYYNVLEYENNEQKETAGTTEAPDLAEAIKENQNVSSVEFEGQAYKAERIV